VESQPPSKVANPRLQKALRWLRMASPQRA
jgi:hypothetical protein